MRISKTYESLRDGMVDVFREANQLINQKKVNVDGKNVSLHFFLCGDMKFKQKVLVHSSQAGQAQRVEREWVTHHQRLQL